MGFFDFLNPKKKGISTSIYAKNLTLEEKAAIYLMMLFMVSQIGNREPHQEEMKYIHNMKESILGLTDKDMKLIDVENYDFFPVVTSMSESDRKFFASVFYGLSTIVQDQQILKITSTLVGDMGFPMEDLAKQQAQTQDKMNGNSYIDDRFKTNK